VPVSAALPNVRFWQAQAQQGGAEKSLRKMIGETMEIGQ
jgi:hypothetical protein